MARAAKVLGIDFYTGTASEAVCRMRDGGLLVAPAGPALQALEIDPAYREALIEASVVLPDSAFMVLTWNIFNHEQIRRLSGLEYLRALLRDGKFRNAKDTLWVFPNAVARDKHLRYLAILGIAVDQRFIYLAPDYTIPNDFELLDIAQSLRPGNIVITLGGGIQERLGLFLNQRLDHRPAIHCIGAALSFESGDQVSISPLADKLYLGWLRRCLSNPILYFPRYLRALRLVPMIYRHRRTLPPLSRKNVPAGVISDPTRAL